MANQYKNKVVYGGNTLIDLSEDTVTAETLMSGYTAHGADGAPITGTCVPVNGYTVDDVNDATKPIFNVSRSNFVSGVLNLTGTTLFPFAFAGTAITEVHGTNITAPIQFNYGGASRDALCVFADCLSLTTVDFPKLTRLGESTFSRCPSLVNVIFPSVTTVAGDVFRDCSSMKTIVMPAITSSTYTAFRINSAEKIDLYSPTTIPNNGFQSNTSMTTLIIRKSDDICTLGNVGGFLNTPFASGKAGGTLYVPSALISSYQAATNWSTILGYANNQIKSIESTHTDPNAPIDLTLYYADGTLIPTT